MKLSRILFIKFRKKHFIIIKNTIYSDKTGLLDPKVKARLDPNHLYSDRYVRQPGLQVYAWWLS